MVPSKALFILLVFIGQFFSIDRSSAATQCADLFRPAAFNLFVQFKTKSVRFISKINPNRRPETILSDDEKVIWQSLVSPDSNFKKLNYVMGIRDSSNPMLWFVWKKIPQSSRAAIIELLSRLEGDDFKIRRDIKQSLKTVSEDPLDNKLYFEALVSTWLSDRLVNGASFSDWLEVKLADYEKQISEEPRMTEELKEKYEWGVFATQIKKLWSEKSAVHPLTVSPDGNQIQVLENIFPVKIDSSQKSILINVPRNRVKIAAWNPIYTEVLIKKLSERSAPLKKYPGFLGADGFFYLLDGNHRFSIDQRESIWVEMSYPAKSASLSITFDAMGIKQPSIEELAQLFKNEISLSDLMQGRPISDIKFMDHVPSGP